MFMDKLEEEGIEFADRFDAMNKAFELVQKERRGLIAESLLGQT